MEDNRCAFSVIGCSYGYHGQACIRDITMTVKPGMFYGLIGPNGSGKTTFINLLAGLNPPDSGEIRLFGRPLASFSKAQLAHKVSLVPQNFSLEFEYTVFDIVMMGRHPYIPRFSQPSLRDREIVEQALQTLDIYHLKSRFVSRLSGGERQRVMVARSLAQDTDILLLDEATANLDIRHSIDIMKSLKHIVREKGVTIVSAIHDLDLAAAFCDELLVLDNGTLPGAGPVAKTLTPEMLKKIFNVDAQVSFTEDRIHHVMYRYNNEA